MIFKIATFTTNKFAALSNWVMDKYSIKNFWKYGKGKGIRICVLDSGIPEHEDLIINPVLSKNFVSHEGPQDHYNHATGVIGILNSQLNFTNNDGICPDAEIIAYKVLDSNGAGDDHNILEALKECIFTKPDIINMSFGTSGYISDEFENILKILKDSGCFIICASGNRGTERLDYPASSDNCVSIGAIDNNNLVANFSSYGNELEFVMPGTNLYSTCGKNKYCFFTGTSFACPVFTGVLAIYLSHLKENSMEYTVDSVIDDFKKCALDLGKVGKDDVYGWGSVDLNCLYELPHRRKKPKINWLKKLINKIKWRFF